MYAGSLAVAGLFMCASMLSLIFPAVLYASVIVSNTSLMGALINIFITSVVYGNEVMHVAVHWQSLHVWY